MTAERTRRFITHDDRDRGSRRDKGRRDARSHARAMGRGHGDRGRRQVGSARRCARQGHRGGGLHVRSLGAAACCTRCSSVRPFRAASDEHRSRRGASHARRRGRHRASQDLPSSRQADSRRRCSIPRSRRHVRRDSRWRACARRSLGQARAAAHAVRISYEPAPFAMTAEQRNRGGRAAGATQGRQHLPIVARQVASRGDADRGLADAES